MKLYGFPPSPNSWQVRALAAHLGVPLEFEFVDITKGESHTPAYLALNPTGRTPTLVDGDFKLWESHAIMQYIASKTASSLWPDDVRARADITRWQSWTLAHWDPGSLGAAADRSAAVLARHRGATARGGVDRNQWSVIR
jgi:glutathione S-transferase